MYIQTCVLYIPIIILCTGYIRTLHSKFILYITHAYTHALSIYLDFLSIYSHYKKINKLYKTSVIHL